MTELEQLLRAQVIDLAAKNARLREALTNITLGSGEAYGTGQEIGHILKLASEALILQPTPTGFGADVLALARAGYELWKPGAFGSVCYVDEDGRCNSQTGCYCDIGEGKTEHRYDCEVWALITAAQPFADSLELRKQLGVE